MKKIQKKNIEKITMVIQYLDGQISISSNMKLKIKKSLQVTEKVKSKTNKQVKVLRSNQVLMKASPTASEKETSGFKKSSNQFDDGVVALGSTPEAQIENIENL
jgi:hypothetical protein